MKKIIFLVLVFVLLASGCSLEFPEAKTARKILKPEQAKTAVEKFINETLLPADMKATVKGITDEGSVYNINLEVEGKAYTSYMTKDGKKFFQSGIDMRETAESGKAQAGNSSAGTEIPKSSKPKVELFVMTHCPYGLQAEKGILPTLKVLGNKIEASVKFVHYFMHGDEEEQETYSQICIRQEQPVKYYDYLDCFTVEGDRAKCLSVSGVDKGALNNCVKAKAKSFYQADSESSQKYGVQGSPTLVINGIQSGAGRDAASYLTGICAAFDSAPTECSEKLPSTIPSAGFGEGSGNAGANSGGCGQ